MVERHCLIAMLVVAVVALAALCSAAPDMSQLPADRAQVRVDQAMATQSPAQAIEDAIRYDPAVAAALQSNDSNLYLLKKVTYTNGTVEDLGLPKEQLLRDGAPDRVRVADKIVYASPTKNSDAIQDTSTNSSVSTDQHLLGIHASLQLVPVPIN